MSDVSDANRNRWRAILISREFKWLFTAVPERFAWILEEPTKWTLRRFFLRWVVRWLFVSEDGDIHRAGEVVLAHLRRRGGYLRPTNFSTDPLTLARRMAERELVDDFFYFLNLDEGDVRNMMELDDGLE